MRYIFQVFDTFQGATSHIDDTVLPLVHLDAFISIVVFFCDGGVDKVGGHCQKLYSNPFSSFSPVAFSQLIETVATFVL